MLAAELALAGVDVVIVERRAEPGARRLARRGPARAHHRGARSAGRRRAVPRRRARRTRSSATPGSAWTSATSRPATTTCSRSGRATSSASWPAGSTSSGSRSSVAREVVGFAQDDAGVDVELSDGTIAPGRVPRRLRRRAQRGPQGRRHRLPRVGPDDELDDRRGRDGRGAGDRHAPRGWRHRSRRPGGGRRAVRGRAARSSRSSTTGEPTLQDLRDALVAAYGTDFGVHSPTWISRFTDMSRQAAVLPRRPGAARRRRRPRPSAAGRPGPQRRRAGRREPRVEAGPGGRRDLAREPPRHVPRRTASGRCPGAAQHHGAGRAQPARRAAARPSATP